MAPNRSVDSFAGWWLGGFGCAGATIAGVLAATSANVSLLASTGIVVLGTIAGVLVGVEVAAALVVTGDELGWDEQPPTSRFGGLYLLYLRLDGSFGGNR